jgi:hypothetical protein
MAEDFSRATGQPKSIILDGCSYKVAKLNPRIVGELTAWLKTVVPNPKQEALEYMKGQSDEVAKHIWSGACAEAAYWPPDITSDEGRKHLLLNANGQVELLYALLHKHAADFTREKAAQLAERLEIEDFGNILSLSLPGEGGDTDPNPKGSPVVGAT